MTSISSHYWKFSQNLVGICAFDLVAQHGNFTRAAEVLGISQSAISQRIRGLELELGVVLFRREHRGVTLTNEGLRLFNAVNPAMRQLSTSVTSLLDRKSKPRVRLSADFAFSTFWLLPRLPQLRSDLGEEIEIQILASQVPPDPNNDDCDITIHVSHLSRMAEGDVLLLKERVAAVCSPLFLEANGAISSSSELLDTQLLSLSKPPTAEWQTWRGWFDELEIIGAASKSYVSFNNYDMVTQAAVAGQGVALGWLGLIDGLLKNGALVQATEDIVDSDAGYVMSRDFANPSPGPSLVFEWIANQVKSDKSSEGRKRGTKRKPSGRGGKKAESA